MTFSLSMESGGDLLSVTFSDAAEHPQDTIVKDGTGRIVRLPDDELARICAVHGFLHDFGDDPALPLVSKLVEAAGRIASSENPLRQVRDHSEVQTVRLICVGDTILQDLALDIGNVLVDGLVDVAVVAVTRPATLGFEISQEISEASLEIGAATAQAVLAESKASVGVAVLDTAKHLAVSANGKDNDLIEDMSSADGRSRLFCDAGGDTIIGGTESDICAGTCADPIAGASSSALATATTVLARIRPDRPSAAATKTTVSLGAAGSTSSLATRAATTD